MFAIDLVSRECKIDLSKLFAWSTEADSLKFQKEYWSHQICPYWMSSFHQVFAIVLFLLCCVPSRLCFYPLPSTRLLSGWLFWFTHGDFHTEFSAEQTNLFTHFAAISIRLSAVDAIRIHKASSTPYHAGWVFCFLDDIDPSCKTWLGGSTCKSVNLEPRLGRVGEKPNLKSKKESF
jgi:hypothetical protein